MELPNDLKEDINYVKVEVNFFSDLLEQQMVETLWAIPVDSKNGIYQLDNIPFYAPLLSSGDWIFAKQDNENSRLLYQHTIKESGNSTIHVVILDEKMELHSICDEFYDLGCSFEGCNESYFALEVAKEVHYKQIKDYLEQLEAQGKIGYSESCLSEWHYNQL